MSLSRRLCRSGGWLLLCLGVACSDGEPPAPVPAYRLSPERAARLETLRTEVLADTCYQGEDPRGCPVMAVSFAPTRDFAMKDGTGEALLIVDDFPTLPPRVLRYRNRILGYYEALEGGDVIEVDPGWSLPPKLHEALTTFATEDFIPAEVLRPLAQPLQSSYPAISRQSVGHGSTVLSLLAEANPQQPIVLMRHPSLYWLSRSEFCEPTGEPGALERLRGRAQRAATGLRNLMERHRVRFVNLSLGETIDTLRLTWPYRCAGEVPGVEVLRAKLAAYAPITQVLFATPGVFTAQAAIDAKDPLDSPYDFPSAEYPNRLRVGFFTTLESGLDVSGRGDTSKLQGWPARENVDVYLNSGVIPTRPFTHNTTPWLQVDSFGVDIFPITAATTSWMAPLALSRFIHVRYERFADRTMSDELIQRIRKWMVPSACEDRPDLVCVFQDPLAHGQLEVMRLGYRPREYVAP
ncbi:hypothetical protein LXT21_26880 [Myxococcus sp. K38C18041901]|uniref:hypothetical protein n=1 Tax=Myxococcus guangdongensis TaxID=2906760 RepID=UPI0020A7952C|nr:hypothetical protein [Myxococcus guangdongensis]MCP3062421.1 hypothetical protein [Myxococcus guangdongensis]